MQSYKVMHMMYDIDANLAMHSNVQQTNPQFFQSLYVA
jgi:hypothetical protein